MAFTVIKRNKLRVHVKGQIAGEPGGAPVEFDFHLVCKRLTQSEIDAVMDDKKALIKDFCHANTESWEGVIGELGAPVPFSQDALDQVLDEPGMRSVCFAAYMRDVSAVAKN